MINKKQYQPLIVPSIFWEKSVLTDNYGECVIQPLEASFGHTIANTLRRVLLGGIESSAVSSVVIEGINNEFSVIPGVVDDSMVILLRLQQLVIANETGMDGKIELSTTATGAIYAKDLMPDDHLKIINKDLLITTISEGGSLKMTLFVTSGRGYKKADWGNKKQLQGESDNRIFINVTYSPVKSVSFEVQKTRVGDDIGYDKIIMHIATNGSITPQAAMDYAVSITMNQFESLTTKESLINFDNKLSVIYSTEKSVTKNLEESWKIPKLKENFAPELFLKSIDILGLPARAHNCLISAGVERIIDLVNMTEQDIWMLKNFGKKSYDDLAQVMKELGLSFEMNINEKQILKYMEKQV
jgi:DNA-directed RNA polymerase subunit alpha